jgi:hypothetical protein
LGALAYRQENFKNALIYTIQAYLLFDALRSPSRALAERNIARIRSQMDDETFMTHWQMFAGDRPVVAAMEPGETQDTDRGKALTVEQLPSVVSSVISQGTAEQRQQFAAVLIEMQQQLPPEAAPVGRFFGCLAAALRGETPEVGLLEAPFTELWQVFEERLRQ